MRKDFIIKNIIKVFPSKLINLQQYYLIKYSNGRVKLEPILWSEIELEVKILGNKFIYTNKVYFFNKNYYKFQYK